MNEWENSSPNLREPYKNCTKKHYHDFNNGEFSFNYPFIIKINQISRKPVNKGKSRVYTGKDGDFTTNLLLFKSLAIMNM